MIIGIPREIMHDENRVAATPATCAKYVQDGHKVLVESGAGEGAYFHDTQYAQAGATVAPDALSVYENAELILKVKEPQFNKALGRHEVDMMRPGQYLITFIHPAAPSNHEMVGKLARRGVIGMTLDGVPRISRAQSMDALTSMSTCAGYKGTIMGCNLLPRFAPQIFSAVGMIKPINMLVVGAGVGGFRLWLRENAWAQKCLPRISAPLPGSKPKALALRWLIWAYRMMRAWGKAAMPSR